VKPYSSRAYGSDRTNVEGWPGIRSEDASEGLYWKLASDLLFAVRPSYGGRFVYEAINPAFEAVLGLASQDISELAVCDCMGSNDARAVYETLDACLAEATEVRVRHRLAFGGSPQTIETVVVPICDPVTGSIVRLIGSHRIVNDAPPDAAPDPISDSRPGMTVQLVSIQEDIQQRIASDLHDSTCQHLIAASLGVMRLRGSLDEPAATERLCNDIDASIDQALREIRAFAYLLHPQNLTVAGLKATIEQYANGFAARTSLKVSAGISPDVDRLPYEAQRSLLRVIQEALTNVFRHAKATEVEIVIEAVDRHFRLRISDNGRGMPAGRAIGGTSEEPAGVGIPAMRARLQQIGGTLDIRSAPGAQRPGTTLCALFPRNLAGGKTLPAKSRRRHQGAHKQITNGRIDN
jgi:signal transduction histidine kinase